MQERLQRMLDRIRDTHREILGDNLTGIYVHGSIAFGCFRWESGDIDYLAVVREPVPLRERIELVETLLRLDRDAPPKGIEMSVVLERHCRDFVHPTPFDFHFSNMHKEAARRDPAAFCGWMHGEDEDLAAHFSVVREAGIPLCGPEARDVFAPVPREAFLDSVRSDIRGACGMTEDPPVYRVLTLCRVLAYLREGRFLSKEQGGEWGIRNLPVEYARMIRKLTDKYRGADVPWTEADRACAVAFTAAMTDEVLAE